MARNKTDAPLQALFERQQFSNVAYQFFAALRSGVDNFKSFDNGQTNFIDSLRAN